MSRGPDPSDPTGPRGSSKGGLSKKRGAPPADPASPRGNPITAGGGASSSRGPDPSMPPSTPAASTSSNPFDMPLTALITTEKGKGLVATDVNSAGLHLTLPALDLDKTQSAQDLIRSLYSMKPADLKSLQQQMVAAGYLAAKDSGGTGLVTGMADQATVNAYQIMLQDVYRYQQNPDTKDMTIGDLLKQRALAYQAGGGSTTTKKTITQFSPIQAQGFLQGAYEKYLGRGATQAEVEAFSSSLNAYSQANPSVSSQTVDQLGNKIDEKDSPSVDPSTMAENDALQNHTSEAKGYAGDNTLLTIMSHLGLPQ